MKKKSIEKRQLHRDCWDLNSAFVKWLYVRVPIYLRDASKMVNLDWHKFDWQGEQRTQREMIQLLINDLEYVEHYTSGNLDLFEKKMKEIMDIWYLIYPTMWW